MNTQQTLIAGYIDFPEQRLGALSPPAMYPYVPCRGGEAAINGVALPQNVADELRRLGIALSWYSSGELQDAVLACSYDSNLVDDEAGVNFQDKLQLGKEEQKRTMKLWKFRNAFSPENCSQSSFSCKDEECGLALH